MRAGGPSAHQLFLHVGGMIREMIIYKGMILHGSGWRVSGNYSLLRLPLKVKSATGWNDEIGCVEQHTTFLH